MNGEIPIIFELEWLKNRHANMLREAQQKQFLSRDEGISPRQYAAYYRFLHQAGHFFVGLGTQLLDRFCLPEDACGA